MLPMTFHHISLQEARERHEAEITDSDLEVMPTEEPKGITPEISFPAIAGMDHPQTFRVLGRLQNEDLIVLIDGVVPIISSTRQWLQNMVYP
ncbi:hypothetical protein FEM48_ZijujUnG0087800 [Ziziphus jujuba var. spinosa]|uniref:Uncharacterized protein n=1 Tax=Ziziphus jujuba var. spinosa TaxID=714518 RepID=A0A978U8K5_ZIZJJ|nr:hypothetical protein FEM48_ZijujUnG0087800 [Ziziphus jujuba var. spinosa]